MRLSNNLPAWRLDSRLRLNLTIVPAVSAFVLALGVLLSVGVATAGAAPLTPLGEPATAPTATTVVLHGELSPGVKVTVGWHFAYSTTAGECTVGSVTASEPEAEVQSLKVEKEVTGLSPNTKYTFCLVATNALAEATAALPLTFETEAVKPAVNDVAPHVTGKTASTAVLHGLVNPEAADTVYH